MQLKFHTVTIEDLMPQDHFLRRLEAALDLSFVRVETAHLYSRRYGRPPIDPVVLAVSYTHLDVYKRQDLVFASLFCYPIGVRGRLFHGLKAPPRICYKRESQLKGCAYGSRAI